jgi:hypothetical protein
VREPASDAGARGRICRRGRPINRHYVRREKANSRRRATSLLDGGRVARLRNVRLSDDRPIRQFFIGVAEAYTMGYLEEDFLCFWLFGLMRGFWAIDARVNNGNAAFSR